MPQIRNLARWMVIALLLSIAVVPITSAQEVRNGEVSGNLRTWHRVSVTFTGPDTSEQADPNPFTDYRLLVTFTNGSTTYVVPGFYAADGDAANTSADSGDKWRVHFMPDKTGTWTYTASFRTGDMIAIDLDPNAGTSAGFFDGATGSFDVKATNKTGDDFRGKGRLDYVGGHHMQFAQTGDYYLKNGAGSPENFLGYEDFDQTESVGGVLPDFIHQYTEHVPDWQAGDPTWGVDDRGKGIIGAVNYLASEGVNSIYFVTYNLDGGDGQDVWMWTSPGERERFDVSKLDQWEVVFSHMTANGVHLHFITQENENDDKLGGGGMTDIRKLYYRELVARYSHHPAMQWNVGEENDNTTQQQLDIAAYFRSLDPYNHPIAVHSYNHLKPNFGSGEEGVYYDDLLATGAANYEAASIQLRTADINLRTVELRGKTITAGRPWAIYIDEPNNPDVESDLSNVDFMARNGLWGNLMGGGAGIEWYFGYQGDFGDLQQEDFRVAQPLWRRTAPAIDFFQNYVPFWDMAPANGLASGNNTWVLAETGQTYVVFFQPNQASGQSINLTGTEATYAVRWYNPVTGGSLLSGDVTSVTGGSSVNLGNPPGDNSQEWVVLITADEIIEPPPDGTDIIVNGGFENGSKMPDNWTGKSLVKDKRFCNKDRTGDGDTNDPEDKIVSTEGECAFQFKSTPGSRTKLIQKITIGSLSNGYTLTLNADVWGKKLEEGDLQIKVRVIHQDKTKDKGTLPLPAGTYEYTTETLVIPVTGDSKRVKVIIDYRGQKGKVRVDNLSLVTSSPDTPTGIPLPPAPPEPPAPPATRGS